MVNRKIYSVIIIPATIFIIFLYVWFFEGVTRIILSFIIITIGSAVIALTWKEERKIIASIWLALTLYIFLLVFISNVVPGDIVPTRYFDVTQSTCINGTQVSFIIRNRGAGDIGADSIRCSNIRTNASETLAWEYLNGTAAGPSPVLVTGGSMRIKIVNDCTTPDVAKACIYELTLAGTTWKQDLPVYCTG